MTIAIQFSPPFSPLIKPPPSVLPRTSQKTMSRSPYQPLTPVSFAAGDMAEPFIPPLPTTPRTPVPRPGAAYHVTYSYRAQPPQTIVSNLSPTSDRHTPTTPLSSSKMTLIDQFPNPYHPTQPIYPRPVSPRPQLQKPTAPLPPPPIPPLSRSPRLRLFLVILTLLPLPPFLSFSYFLIGHAILRRAFPCDPQWSLPFLSSLNAGATGGSILSLPTLLLLFFILYPLPTFLSTEPIHVRNEDFFDDDDDEDGRRQGPMQRLTKCSAGVVCGAVVVCFGGAACPLGVRVVQERVWDAGHAAVAGLLGGAVFAGGAMVAAVLALSVLPGCCVVLRRRRNDKY